MDYYQSDALINAQSVDPMGVAHSIVEDDNRQAVGLGMLIAHRQRDLTHAICSENDDIHYEMGIEECMRIIGEEGFSITEAGTTKCGRLWMLWHDEFKLLGQLTSYTRHTGFEKLNSLTFNGQFTGKEASKAMSKGGWRGGGTVKVRRSDLEDVYIRDWNIRDGLRHFMRTFADSGAAPVEAWVDDRLYLSGNDDTLGLLPQGALKTIRAKTDTLALHELHKYGK